ncbi:MAG: hypothetical protein ACYDHT_05370, partial [Solirubrobacteraceae bacterium]
MEWDDLETRSEGELDQAAEVIRLHPLRVLVVSPDHRYRAVVEMLLERRDCHPFGLGSCSDVAATIARERIDVVLVDGEPLLREVAHDVALSDAVCPPVGVVLVCDAQAQSPTGLRALVKWGEFEELLGAIGEADRARARPSAQDWTGALGIAHAAR